MDGSRPLSSGLLIVMWLRWRGAKCPKVSLTIMQWRVELAALQLQSLWLLRLPRLQLAWRYLPTLVQ